MSWLSRCGWACTRATHEGTPAGSTSLRTPATRAVAPTRQSIERVDTVKYVNGMSDWPRVGEKRSRPAAAVRPTRARHLPHAGQDFLGIRRADAPLRRCVRHPCPDV